SCYPAIKRREAHIRRLQEGEFMALFESAASSARFFERKIARLRFPVSYASVTWQVAVLDALVIVFSCIVAGIGYHLIAVPNFIPEFEVLAGVGILAAAFYV